MTAALVGGIGLVAFAAPAWVIRRFSDDASVLAAGTRYLRLVAPSYALFGLGMGLWFAAQGRAGSGGRSSAACRASWSRPGAAGSPSTASAAGCPACSRWWRCRS